jgi:hypothetical protein
VRRFDVSEKLFEEKCEVFFCLIHYDKQYYKRMHEYSLRKLNFLETMREVFGSMPNKKNLKIFFDHPVI